MEIFRRTCPPPFPPDVEADLSTSSQPSETSVRPSSVPPVASLIRDRVLELANRSVDRTDFYRLLAVELIEHFQAGLVAVESVEWAVPMMLVADQRLSQSISRSELTDLLTSAGDAPVACNISLEEAKHVATEGLDTDLLARGLRIEILPSPHRTALLLVYPLLKRPHAITQIEDLRQLQHYGESAREVLDELPLPTSSSPAPNPSSDGTSASLQMLTPVDQRDDEHRSVAHHRSLRLLHRDLDLDSTCFRIANESRRLLGCDRVSVLVSRGNRFYVSAVSGVAVVDRRGNAIAAIERLVNAVAVMARPMLLPSRDPLPPQIHVPLETYRDETGVTSAFVLPLHSPDGRPDAEGIEASDFDPFAGDGDCIGVIVLEYFSGTAPNDVNLPMTIVAGEATLALRNSLEHRRVFGLKLWKSVGTVLDGRRLPWIALGLATISAMLVASIIVKVEHHVVARGMAEPSLRRDVFATIDGIVKTLHVTDGQFVKAGQPLFELENAELESRAEALAGEIVTTTQRLASVRAVRLSSDADPAQSSRLAIELRQVESELASLRGQLSVLQAQQKELIVLSPIDGSVVGWSLERRLADRPVARGNVLASVVDPTGPWSLRLQIPDRDAGEVIEAAKSNAKLPIEFAIATLPESSFKAELDHVATASRMDETGKHVVDAVGTIRIGDATSVDFDRFDIESMRSGADVTAKVACGQRTVLRSWFGDVFDFVHRNILFYF